MSDQPLDYDTVAFALLNAFSKGEMEDEKDNSLAVSMKSRRSSWGSCTRTTPRLAPSA